MLRDRRIMVTGGGGFLGTAVVERLERRRRRPRSSCRGRSDYDLRTRRRRRSARSPTAGRRSSSTWPPSSAASARTGRTLAGSSTRTRSWASQLMEQATARRRREVRARSARSAPTRSSRRCRSRKTTCGTATRRRLTRRTASRRRCSWCRGRRIASSTASTSST